MKNGTLIQEGLANIKPTNKGLMAAPVVRATFVIPAAAERSSARTTAIVYDCLVGTSIWLILKRTRRTKTASLRLGISGTRMSKMLEGRCVKTIVLTRPKREARRDASSAEIPAKIFAQKKMTPSVPGFTPNRRKNQYAAKLCTTKPPANESSANRLESFITTRWEWPIPKKLPIVPGKADPSCGKLTSAAGERRVKENANRTPRTAYRTTTTR